MKLSNILALASLVMVGSLVFSSFAGGIETFRYKLTIKVRVDGRPYEASSVLEARQQRSVLCTPIESSYCYPKFYVKGVAPMIMLPDGGVIFAALQGYFSDNPPPRPSAMRVTNESLETPPTT